MNEMENIIVIDGKEYIMPPEKVEGKWYNTFEVSKYLKHCPFCGGRAELRFEGSRVPDKGYGCAPHIRIVCTRCLRTFEEQSLNGYYRDIRLIDLDILRHTVGAWNTRTPEPEESSPVFAARGKDRNTGAEE